MKNQLFLAAILAFASSSAFTTNAQAAPDTYDTLADFYHATHGANWTRQDNWLSKTVPVCQWHGVVCNHEGDVTELQLYDNYLEGALPESLCELPALETLYLSFNHIGGQLPQSLGECKALKNLWLKANELTGSIPSTLCEGGHIEYLDLHANQLSGEIPDGIANCVEATVVRLDDNKLEGELPAGVWTLSKLVELHVDRNQLSGSLARMQPLPVLEHLYLGNNAFDGELPVVLGSMHSLVTLRAENNHFVGAVPREIGQLHALQVLRLDHNRLEGDAPKGLFHRAEPLQVCDFSATLIECASAPGCSC